MKTIKSITQLTHEERERQARASWGRIQEAYNQLSDAGTPDGCPHCQGQGTLQVRAQNATASAVDAYLERQRDAGFTLISSEAADDGTMLFRFYCGCSAGRDVQQGVYEKYTAQWGDIGIPPRYRQFSFATWEQLPAPARQANRLAYHAARLFAQRVDRGHWLRMGEAVQAAKRSVTLKSDPARNGLVLYGDVGRGKTGLAVSIANELHGIEPYLFLRVQMLIQRIQNTYNRDRRAGGPPADSRKQIIDRVKSVPLLILDEFTLEIDSRRSADRAEILEHIIRHRHEWQLPIVITTNHGPARFAEAWGKRIADVLLENSHWIALKGDNIRVRDQIGEEQ